MHRMVAIGAVLLLSAATLSDALLLTPATRVASRTHRVAGVYCDASELPQGWREVVDSASGKPYYYNAASGVTQWQKPIGGSYSVAESSTRSLTPASTWKVKIDLTAPVAEGAPLGAPVTINADLRFAEEEGFEPPQGFLRIERCVPEGALTLGEQPARWQLSEDPEDRKDSLWIWGLFSDPLYPFILLSFELAAPLEVAEGVSIPAGTLFCQVDHRRKDGAVQLGEGAVTYKVSEKLNADLVGLSQVTYDEPIKCGTIRFVDTASDMRKSVV